MLIGDLAQLVARRYEPKVGNSVAVERVLAIGVTIHIKHLGDIYPGVHVKVIVGRPLTREVTHFELQRVAVMNFRLDAYHFG